MLPRNDCSTVFLWASESFETAVKDTGLDQLGLNPELASALGAGKAILPGHLFKPFHKPFTAGALHQPVEFGDPGGPTNEDLHSTGIADDVRFVFLSGADLPRLRTYGTGEHPLANEHCHGGFSSDRHTQRLFRTLLSGHFLDWHLEGHHQHANPFAVFPCNSAPFPRSLPYNSGSGMTRLSAQMRKRNRAVKNPKFPLDTMLEKPGRGHPAKVRPSEISGRAENYRMILDQVWDRLWPPLSKARSTTDVIDALQEGARPYDKEFIPLAELIVGVLQEKKFPKRREAQINFAADSLAGLGSVTPRRSRDICDQERAIQKGPQDPSL
jgi:hypothetical protein